MTEHHDAAPAEQEAIDVAVDEQQWVLAWQCCLEGLSNQSVNIGSKFEIWMDHIAGRSGDSAGASHAPGYTTPSSGLFWRMLRERLSTPAQNFDEFLGQFKVDEERLLQIADDIVRREAASAVAPTTELIRGNFAAARIAMGLMQAESEAAKLLPRQIAQALYSYSSFLSPNGAVDRFSDYVPSPCNSLRAFRAALDELVSDMSELIVAQAASMLFRGVSWLLVDEGAGEPRYSSSLWVLLVGGMQTQQFATVARLALSSDEKALWAKLYPDPIQLGVVAFDQTWHDSFRAAMRFEAPDNVHFSQRWHLNFLNATLASKLASQLDDQQRPRWTTDDLRRLPYLLGNSASATATCLLQQAIVGRPVYDRMVISAAIDSEGGLQSVGGLLPKLGLQLWRTLLEQRIDYCLIYEDPKSQIAEWLEAKATTIKPNLLHRVPTIPAAILFIDGLRQIMEGFIESEYLAGFRRLSMILPETLTRDPESLQRLHVPLKVIRSGRSPLAPDDGIGVSDAVDDWLASSGRSLVITGACGSGKTWASVQLCQVLLDRLRHTGFEQNPIPIWTTAEEVFRYDGNMHQFIEEAIAPRLTSVDRRMLGGGFATSVVDQLLLALKEERLVFLIDGWDEHRNEESLSERVLETIQASCRVVLFTRPEVPVLDADADAGADPGGIDERELLPMDRAATGQFIQNWFQNDVESGRAFTRQVVRRMGYRTLLNVPLFAALLCWLWEGRQRLPELLRAAGLPGSHLPDSPADLMRVFILAYLTRAQRKGSESLNSAQVWIHIVPKLARQALDEFNGERWAIDVDSDVGKLHAAGMLGRGLFDETDGKILHQSFAEWLAAFQLQRYASKADDFWDERLRSGAETHKLLATGWQPLYSTYLQIAPIQQSKPLVDFVLQYTDFGESAGARSVASGFLQCVQILSGLQRKDEDTCLKVLRAAVDSKLLDTNSRQAIITLLTTFNPNLSNVLSRELEERVVAGQGEPHEEIVDHLRMLYRNLGEKETSNKLTSFLARIEFEQEQVSAGIITLTQLVATQPRDVSDETVIQRIRNLWQAIEQLNAESDAVVPLSESLRSLLRRVNAQPEFSSDLLETMLDQFLVTEDSTNRAQLAANIVVLLKNNNINGQRVFGNLLPVWFAESDRSVERRLRHVLTLVSETVPDEIIDKALSLVADLKHGAISVYARSTLISTLVGHSSGDAINTSASQIFRQLVTEPDIRSRDALKLLKSTLTALEESRHDVAVSSFRSIVATYAECELAGHTVNLGLKEALCELYQGFLSEAEIESCIETYLSLISRAAPTTEEIQSILKNIVTAFLFEENLDSRKQLSIAMREASAGVGQAKCLDVIEVLVELIFSDRETLVAVGDALGKQSTASRVRARCSECLPEITHCDSTTALELLQKVAGVYAVDERSHRVNGVNWEPWYRRLTELLDANDARSAWDEIWPPSRAGEVGSLSRSSALGSLVGHLPAPLVEKAFGELLALGQQDDAVWDSMSVCRMLESVVAAFDTSNAHQIRQLFDLLTLSQFVDERPQIFDLAAQLVAVLPSPQLVEVGKAAKQVGWSRSDHDESERFWTTLIVRMREAGESIDRASFMFLVELMTNEVLPCDFEDLVEALEMVLAPDQPETTIEALYSLLHTLLRRDEEEGKLLLPTCVQLTESLDALSSERLFDTVHELWDETADSIRQAWLAEILESIAEQLSPAAARSILESRQRLPAAVLQVIASTHGLWRGPDGAITYSAPDPERDPD